MSQGDPGLHPGHPAVWAGSGLVLHSHQARGAVCCPQVGLAALEGDAILAWCGNGWAQRACSGPGLDSLASAGFTSFPDNGISEGVGECHRGDLGPEDLGLKILKESRTEARMNRDLSITHSPDCRLWAGQCSVHIGWSLDDIAPSGQERGSVACTGLLPAVGLQNQAQVATWY